MAKPANLHYAYLMNQNAKGIGLAGPIENLLASRTQDYLLDAFNQTDFSFDQKPGMSADSLRVLDIFSTLDQAPEVGVKTKSVVNSFVGKI